MERQKLLTSDIIFVKINKRGVLISTRGPKIDKQGGRLFWTLEYMERKFSSTFVTDKVQ